jgi:hypothetical protein
MIWSLFQKGEEFVASRGYSKIFLVSDGISEGIVQIDGGEGPKHQGMTDESAQISTKATRLMVIVKVGVLYAF